MVSLNKTIFTFIQLIIHSLIFWSQLDENQINIFFSFFHIFLSLRPLPGQVNDSPARLEGQQPGPPGPSEHPRPGPAQRVPPAPHPAHAAARPPALCPQRLRAAQPQPHHARRVRLQPRRRPHRRQEPPRRAAAAAAQRRPPQHPRRGQDQADHESRRHTGSAG